MEAAGGREFGSVFVNDKENLALASVAAGWARVRPSGGHQSPFYEDLIKAQDAAEAKGLGLHTKKGKNAGFVRDTDQGMNRYTDSVCSSRLASYSLCGCTQLLVVYLAYN